MAQVVSDSGRKTDKDAKFLFAYTTGVSKLSDAAQEICSTDWVKLRIDYETEQFVLVPLDHSGSDCYRVGPNGEISSYKMLSDYGAIDGLPDEKIRIDLSAFECEITGKRLLRGSLRDTAVDME